MSAWSIAFSPFLPWPALYALAAAALAVSIALVWRGVRGAWLRALLEGVDVPELEPVPHDHVLTKTFYLLDRIVGRTAIGQTWIEALPPPDPNDRVQRPARAGDSVSPIVIASDDLAAAWAEDAGGRPLYPLIPGGARQRELALRSGINLVMYTLTGNYKADQVHAKDILERLTR